MMPVIRYSPFISSSDYTRSQKRTYQSDKPKKAMTSAINIRSNISIPPKALSLSSPFSISAALAPNDVTGETEIDEAVKVLEKALHSLLKQTPF